MQLTNDKILPVLDALRNKTVMREAHWRLGTEPNSLSIILPGDFVLSISRNEGETYYVTLGDAPLGKGLEVKDGPLLSSVRGLYDAAESYIFDAMVTAVNQPGHIGRSSLILGPFIIAGETGYRPTDDDQRQLFQRIAGKWQLDFSRGKEDLVIDEKGLYRLENLQKPKFQLVVLGHNDDWTEIEVAKDRFDNKHRFQIESLTVSNDRMEGFAKHDGHKLTYIRK